ncbi:MAG: ferrochelatase [Acidobacteriota bacterium]
MSTAIILSTYGEPTENTFADQWMYSYRILRRLTRKIAKIPTPILPIIATKRAFDRVSMWKEHDFTSPLEPLTDETVVALREALEARDALHDADDRPLIIARSYEFRRPSLADILPGLREQGCDRFVLVPMYMGTGDFTLGMTEIATEDALKSVSWLEPEMIEYCVLTDSDLWISRMADACAAFVAEQCAERGIELPATDWAACLGAHGSVQTPTAGVDNGVLAFGELCWKIYSQVRGNFGMARNGWLNHERGGRWTEPSVERLLPRLREAGYDKLVYFPWGFTTDNAESALEGRIFCDEMENPFERVEYMPCLNTAPQLIDLLADRVRAHLKTADVEDVAVA